MKEYGYMKSQQHITGFVIPMDTMCKIITLPKTGRANIVIKEYQWILDVKQRIPDYSPQLQRS